MKRIKLTASQMRLRRDPDDYKRTRAVHIIRSLVGDYAQFPETEKAVVEQLDAIIYDATIVALDMFKESLDEAFSKTGPLKGGE